ncbi:MAG TPA: hypothetical protein VF137_04840 [Candidatus Dormibacteraeota bacterium]
MVPDDPAAPPSLELLRTHVSERLPRYACPSEVVLTRAIPVLASGKPDLASLKAAGTLRGREQSPPRSVNQECPHYTGHTGRAPSQAIHRGS